MIYNIGSTIELVGQEADNFLEDSGITICDDEIIIEDAVVEFDAAIEHLAENGISLYKDCIILEGEALEKYKARKAKEREENIEKEDKTAAHRNERNVGYKTRRYDIITGKPTNNEFMAGFKKQDKEKMKRDEQNRDKAAKVFNSEIDRRNKDASGKIRKIETDEDGDMTDRSYWDFTKAADATMRHVRRHPKQYARNESTIFDSVELTGIDEQVFFKYKKDSQGLLHAEAKKFAGIVNSIDLSDDSHLSKYGIHIDKIEYADDSFILRRKFNVKIHFGYDYKIKSEDIDYEVVEKLMDAILAKAGYRKYSRYSVKKGNGYLFAIDYQDIYIEESDQYYTVNYGTGDMPMTSGMTSRAHTPEQRYIDFDFKCIEDTPGNMGLLRK